MSRIKSRTQPDVCGDCSAPDPAWASVNHGILLCADCCSVHRSLGRHISHVKYMRHGTWPPPAAYGFVQLLQTNGANSVWEHALLDPSAASTAAKSSSSSGNVPRRKPTPKDPVHPTKADFIRAKHVTLAFVLKPNLKQFDNPNSGGCGLSANASSSSSVPGLAPTALEVELSKQLRAAVRSPNLETSLRLLVQGANPNYYHEEKGSAPLHVAAKSGQAAQLELLIVFGADLAARDGAGCTATEIARQHGHTALAERLVEAAYEVPDRLANFIGAPRPDHAKGRHLTVVGPNSESATLSNGVGNGSAATAATSAIGEQLKIARGKLQLIPNKIFEELVMDVYDEIDRREMEALWISHAAVPEIGAVPFLPTNPHLSATRNQGRQKLARFSASEFAGLVTDVLLDAQRRQNMATLRPIVPSAMPALNVGSLLKKSSGQLTQQAGNMSDDEPLYDAVASDDDYATLTPIPKQQQQTQQQPSLHSKSSAASVSCKPKHTSTHVTDEVEHLRKILLQSFSEIDELKTMVQHLSVENHKLKSRIEPADSFDFNVPLRIDLQTDCSSTGGAELDEATNHEPVSDSRFACKRPVSMFESRDSPYNSHNNSSSSNNTQHHPHNQKISVIPESRTTSSMYQMAADQAQASTAVSIKQPLPASEEVKHRTDVVTRRIQELWSVVQDQVRDAFIPCAERIRVAIEELAAIFPASIADETIASAMRQLTQNTGKIQAECSRLQRALTSDDQSLTDQYMQDVRNSAYNLASATKMLVTQFA